MVLASSAIAVPPPSSEPHPLHANRVYFRPQRDILPSGSGRMMRQVTDCGLAMFSTAIKQ